MVPGVSFAKTSVSSAHSSIACDWVSERWRVSRRGRTIAAKHWAAQLREDLPRGT